MIAVHNSWLWFPKTPGLVSGIVLAGISLGNLVFNSAFINMINPLNESVDEFGFYPEDVNARFIHTWRVLVSMYLVIAGIGFFFIFPGPQKKNAPESVQARVS